VRIAGPVAVAVGIDAKMYDVVLVGTLRLVGEVIQILGERTVIQVYEDTSGLRPGEPVVTTGKPLSVELGPGLLTSIYDGVQRPLPALIAAAGGDPFIARGASAPALDRGRRWKFTATAKPGMALTGGEVLGIVEEVPGFTHRILVPPTVQGTLSSITSGTYTVEETIGTVATARGKVPLTLKHEWPVRTPRPVRAKLAPDAPLITGQRIMDTLFPIAKGGTAIISGPFGAGKTVNQHQLAKWSDADIIIYVGCGERGNEMTEVLNEFPELKDPRNGAPLMHRTVLIANTSNMPVAAREASIYTGVTIAEYFRDMGYDVAVMADSTSRWAEALREISSRLEEMPGEEGYPAYLASRVAAFYERAALVIPLSAITKGPSGEAIAETKPASLSIIGAVSPPGGDFFEPVTQNSLRVAKAFWALDARLAQKRHFPSINWLEGYTLYNQILEPWHTAHVAPDWKSTVERISRILSEEAQLLEIVQLVGSDSLPPTQQLTLETARLIREGLLQQSAYDALESYCPLRKSYLLMRMMIAYNDKGNAALGRGATFNDVSAKKLPVRIFDFKLSQDYEHEAKAIMDAINALDALAAERIVKTENAEGMR
jgi:V/A-type H+-transporting ATPase subunit A